MSVAKKFVRDFDAIARAGGSEDFALGLCRLELVGETAVKFELSKHQIVLSWQAPHQLGVFCTCSAFQKHGELCHHIWSAILAFDKSTDPDISETRDALQAETLKLKRLTSDESGRALENALPVSEVTKWPFEKVSPRAAIGFKSQTNGNYVFDSVSFGYGSRWISATTARKEFPDRQNRTRIKRNLSAEKELLKNFKGEFALKKLATRKLSASDLKALILGSDAASLFQIDGRQIKRVGLTDAKLEERDQNYHFTTRLQAGHKTVTLKDVLSDSPGSNFLTLPTGELALLEEEWSKRLTILKEGAKFTDENTLSFQRTSLPLFRSVFEGVDGLTISPEANAVFESLSLLGKSGMAEPPASLKASLRSYQAEGLFWLEKMSKSKFGGILADDMGLGKTIQIIAYFLSRREHFRSRPEDHKPCLVVVPKSLVSNWKNEVEKFGPALRVLDFSGPNRVIFRPQHFDIVLTTYHVMKNEIDRLALVEFDSIILDEAQAIKNPTSQISKAVFQLKARQRFALSGTPVENSLRDLFSLLHFTNPGLIPSSFDRIYGEKKSLSLPKAVTEKIAASVKPFILRRTKKQVLTELPDKSEQTLICDMDGPQRSLYERTRKHFKSKLKENAGETPNGPKATRVFEALLRLRQISCHPALVGKLGESIASAKVEMLLEHLEDIRAAGNKALVFSQFTSFLDLLKPELERAEVPYEHLDGKTRNRGAVVDRFNENADTTVFLISLKAGGTGLNLTTASYVFLMDPWWNPAIEAQAIDRAYRMGQKQKVMAYRLIAKGTIEEKIIKLQNQKRELAASLISEGESLVSALSLEDLEFLMEE